MANNHVRVYVGTYTRKLAHVDSQSDGIYIYNLDVNSGEMVYVSKVTGVDNPSYLTMDPQQRFLYAVNEVMELDGEPSGAVEAFQIDSDTGFLSRINQQPSHGQAPCYIGVDQSGRWAMVANYMSGSAAVYPINDDGSLGEASAIIQHEGSSVNANRQDGPHAHCILTDPTNQFAAIADLGIDKVMVYALDHEKGTLSFVRAIPITAGSGPRHIDFHPNGQFAFVINELTSTITVLSYENGNFEEIQTVSALPDDFYGTSHTSAIHVAPSGRFVYGSNRGHDSIAIFQCNAETGQLTSLGYESTQGKTPRDFVIEPNGEFLLAANQDTNTIISYRIDQETGALSATGHIANVPTPVCLKVVQP